MRQANHNSLIGVVIGVGAILMLTSCASTGSFTKADKDNKSIEIYSTSDKRTAMQTANNDSSVQMAVAKLRREVKQSPRDIRSWLNLASLLVAEGAYNDAEESARKALRVDVKNVEARKILAQIAIKRNQPQLAAIIINGISGDEAKDADILNLQALIALAENNNALAMSLFQKALKSEPGNIPVRMNLGVSYLRFRQLNAAAVQFERVLKLMPENADAMLHLAVVKSARGDYNKAEDIYDSILSRKKNNPLALYNLAVLQHRRGDYDDALENIKTYLKTGTPKSVEADEALVLIERIKELKAQKSGTPVSDEEIQELASKVARNVAPSEEGRSQKGRSRTVHPSKQPKAKTNSDPEIEKLERSLIE